MVEMTPEVSAVPFRRLSPLTVACGPVGLKLRAFNNVVFPAPLAPISAHSSPECAQPDTAFHKHFHNALHSHKLVPDSVENCSGFNTIIKNVFNSTLSRGGSSPKWRSLMQIHT